MTKDLYQVVDDLFSRLPLYAVDYCNVREVNKDTIKCVENGRVRIEGDWVFEIDKLKHLELSLKQKQKQIIKKL